MNWAWWLIKRSKTELKIIGATFAVLFLLPIFGVVVIANAGLNEITNALVGLNPITHKIEVKDPNGNIITELEASTVWPVKGYISEEFGVPHLPWQPYHTGIDIANEWHQIGDPVTPFMEGTVIETPRDASGFGNHVIISHGFGITSIYGHLSEITTHKDAVVKPGDLIGLEGSTGASTGPHVHFEIRVSGVPVNPHIFMATEKPVGNSP